jgi:hypothetical protein
MQNSPRDVSDLERRTNASEVIADAQQMDGVLAVRKNAVTDCIGYIAEAYGVGVRARQQQQYFGKCDKAG